MCRVATVPARADFQADVALASGPEPKGVGGGYVHSGPDGHLSLHTKFELYRAILAIQIYRIGTTLHKGTSGHT